MLFCEEPQPCRNHPSRTACAPTGVTALPSSFHVALRLAAVRARMLQCRDRTTGCRATVLTQEFVRFMSIERPWLAPYPAGIPADIDVNAYRSVAAVFEESFQKFRDRPAYKNFGKVLTYGQIDELSTAFAGYLSGELGLKKGDRLAIMLPNLLQYPIVLFGALRLGLTVVNTNPLYTARELHHQLEDSGAKSLVVLDNFAATAQQALDGTKVQHVVTTAVGDMIGFPKGNI